MPDPTPAVPKSTSPADRVALGVQRWGADGFVERCLRVLDTGSWDDEPEIMDYFADYGAALVDRGLGKEGYWLRVWPLRALLYAWPVDATTESATEAAVAAALSDEHWRAREMACKVIVRRNLGAAADDAAGLLTDTVPRVRAAAARVIDAVGEGDRADGLRELLDDADPAVADRAQRALRQLAERLDRSPDQLGR